MIIPSSLSRTMWKHSILLFLPDGYFVIESDFLPPTLQLFCLPSAQKESQMKLWKRWSKQWFNSLWFNLSSVPVVSGRLSLPLRTHDQFQHWTPQYGPYLTHAQNHITQAVVALIGAHQHGIAIGHMNEQSRADRASGLKWVLSETCSAKYMMKKAAKMRDLTYVSYSLLNSGS